MPQRRYDDRQLYLVFAYVVQLEFLGFHTETCCDKVDVYRGPSSRTELIGTFSGDILPGDIFSDSSLFIHFHTDSSVIAKGFKIRYTIWENMPGCSGRSSILTESSGTITIEAIQYSSNMTCSWIIKPIATGIIQVEFVRFYYDGYTLSVYDGENSAALLLGRYNGSTMPGDIFSDNALFVSLQLDTSRTHACTGTPMVLNGSVGTLSPNGTQYGQATDCGWKIQVAPSKRVRLHFLRFDFNSWYGCNDRLDIYDGSDSSASLVYSSFGGSSPGDVVSSGSTIFLSFSANEYYPCSDFRIVSHAIAPVPDDILSVYDGENSAALLLGRYNGSTMPGDIFSDNALFVSLQLDTSRTYGGFEIKYTVSPFESACTGTPMVLKGSVGTLSPNGTQYGQATDCGWKIQVAPSKRVRLHFLRFDFKSWYGCNDRLDIYDGSDSSASLVYSSCGGSSPGDVVSSGSTIFLSFSANDYYPYSDFRIVYHAVAPVPGCGDNIAVLGGWQGTFGISEVPFENNMTCMWKIQVYSTTQQVRLRFENVRLDWSYGCQDDYLQIYDGNDTTASMVGPFCDTSKPSDFVSNGNTVFVSFVSDGSRMHSSFSIQYSATNDIGATTPAGTLTVTGAKKEPNAIRYSATVPREGCGDTAAVLTGSSGYYHFNEVPIDNRMECGWNIRGYDNQQIWLHFYNFRLDGSTDCITVFDGNDIMTPQLMKLCGHGRPRDITSSGSTLFVALSTDGLRMDSYFHFKYRSIIAVDGCFGDHAELHGPNGTIEINSIQYQNDMRCGWKIQQVRLHFVNVSLECCCRDYVSIYDGNSTSARLLHRLCGYNLPSNVISTGNSLFVYFRSNSHNTYSGFSIEYNAIEANCTAGQYLDVDENICRSCERGTYQSKGWQTSCVDCPPGQVTLGEAFTAVSDCVANCSDGHGYNTRNRNCEPCPQGFYRTQGVEDVCVSCPEGKTTTQSGSVIEHQCTIANCTAGQYFSDGARKSCRDCKRGYYQNKPLQYDCNVCPVCLKQPLQSAARVLTIANELDEKKGKCTLCRRGFYRDKAQHFYCQPCPRHLVTPSEGSLFLSDCSQATDSCKNGHNNCTGADDGGTCSLVNGSPEFKCGCREGWVMSGETKCTHKCDMGHCLNGGTCNRDIAENPVCICTSNYEGDRRHVTSRTSHVTSRHVTSRHVVVTSVTSRHVSHVTSRHVTSRHVTSRHVTSRHVTSRHVTSPQTSSLNTLYVIGGGVGVGVLLIILAIVGICCCCCRNKRNSTPGEHTEDPKSSNAHPESSRYVTTPEVGDQVEYDYIDDTALQRRAGNQGRQNAVGPAETGDYLELTATQGDNKDDQYTGLTAIQGAINRVDNKMYESLATEKQRPTHPLPSHR
ncbi:hypothetical protein NP493_919g02007 [Ridgeia piscesae]|uniref:Cubilin n=1 Tax=Ridgeia piscesae TaxID=27915 RepID=A0AAD9NJT1_RIDPI|nr:hypothetical protein NP493_919g02007 [Ridgeia piscesae]